MKKVVCKHCGKLFDAPPRPMANALYNECPLCLIERAWESAQPEKSKLEERLRAQGLTKEQIAKKVSSLHKENRKTLQAMNPKLSEQDLQWLIDEAENDFPSMNKR
jgi:hypothetical protein